MILRNTSVIFSIIILVSCNKYLDEPTSNTTNIATTVTDVNLLMHNTTTLNLMDEQLGENSSDNYYLPYSDFQNLPVDADRQIYTWGADIYTGLADPWAVQYHKIYLTNLALETLEHADRHAGDNTAYNFAKGAALFYRSYTFWKIATAWCKVYNAATSNADLGLPLKLNSNYNQLPRRSSLYDTYQQIINDLIAAKDLLPVSSPYQLNPNKVACFAELSRVYLSMGDYGNAGKYADSSLAFHNSLVDYNQINKIPVFENNPEIIFYTELMSSHHFSYAYSVDSVLYASYAENDLRGKLYYTAPLGSNQKFTGSYGRSSGVYFAGIATDEMYLTRAECAARSGNISAALRDLNILSRNRYANFVDFQTTDKDSLVHLILSERRKELVFRGLRWMDIKRLNREGAGIVVKRIVNGVTYLLDPNDNKYALLIPPSDVNSGIEQNPR